MIYARIEGGLVAELIDTADGALADRFHPDYVAALVEADADTVLGGTYAAGVFGPVPAAPELTDQQQIDALEAEVTPRRIRDAILGQESPANWLADQEAAIAALRAQL